jgi:hypothetical protein
MRLPKPSPAVADRGVLYVMSPSRRVAEGESGSADAHGLAGSLARFGVIDRSTREATSRLDAIYTLVTLDS